MNRRILLVSLLFLASRSAMAQNASDQVQEQINVVARKRELGNSQMPRALQTPAPRDKGFYQHFERGSVYWSPDTGAHAVLTAMRFAWGRSGWEQGAMGFPKSEQEKCAAPDTSNSYQIFEGGRILWKADAAMFEDFRTPTRVGENGKCYPDVPAPRPTVAPSRSAWLPGDSSAVRAANPAALKVWLKAPDAIPHDGCANARAMYFTIFDWPNRGDPRAGPAMFETRDFFHGGQANRYCVEAPIPGRVEGHNTVRFGISRNTAGVEETQIDQWLNVNVDGLNQTNAYTIISVVQRTSPNINNYFFGTTPESYVRKDCCITLGWRWDRTLTLDHTQDFIDLAVRPYSATDGPSIIVAAGDSTSQFLSITERGFQNSASRTQGVHPFYGQGSGIIGKAVTTSSIITTWGFFDGHMFELIVYNRKLPKSEIEKVVKYLELSYLQVAH